MLSIVSANSSYISIEHRLYIQNYFEASAKTIPENAPILIWIGTPKTTYTRPCEIPSLRWIVFISSKYLQIQGEIVIFNKAISLAMSLCLPQHLFSPTIGFICRYIYTKRYSMESKFKTKHRNRTIANR